MVNFVNQKMIISLAKSTMDHGKSKVFLQGSGVSYTCKGDNRINLTSSGSSREEGPGFF